ncbi:cytosine methyltransferase [Pectobacterium brasiliense]|uniref:DNA cytosine methyltransferase n=1 Tax=Pectobacterium brasiliense TaxID=180957 RepID=UPI00057EDE5F|nr:DNA (cytosine-5-)-methyltransferase [Pectobacterium brasiliense]KHS70964.1 cytosine methyltransferase [Pectobacterium brasiliense]
MKNFAEFFAGVGLVREGLSPDGWDCVWSNDISKDKQMTYIANFGDSDFWLGDIWDAARNPETIPDEVFLYTASFPCTDLSVAGSRAGLAGKESGTVNALFEILSHKKNANKLPKVVMLENVSGFLTSHGGRDVIDTVRNLSELGYFVDIVELDAANFSAQSRPRVFVIAVIAELAEIVMHIKSTDIFFDNWWMLFDKNSDLRSNKLRKIILQSNELNWGLFDIVLPTTEKVDLSTIVETNLDANDKRWWNSERKEHLYSQMSDNHKTTLRKMQLNEEYSYGTVYRRMRNGKSMAELRTDGYAGCLRTPRGGSSKQILIRAGKGDWSVRLLTPREYARLQGVRDTFILPENDNKGYFAMGDAVCVPVIKFISSSILERVYLAYLEKNIQIKSCA